MVTGNPLFDAIGSIGIGVLLVVISIFVAVKIKGLLIGQNVDMEGREEITKFLESQPEINKVLNLITLQLGAQVMVAVKVKLESVETVGHLIQNINRCEAALKKQNPAIQWIFFEPDVE